MSDTNGITPTFAAPDDIDEVDGANKDYDYTVTLSSGGVEQAREDITVTVLEKPDITVRCGIISPFFFAYEGDADIELYCTASDAPGDDPPYTWSWSPTDRLTDYDTGTPMFAVLEYVDQDTTWTYTVTASAANADDGAAEVTVQVLNPVNVSVTCSDVEVYEGADDLTLGCLYFYITAIGSFDLHTAIASATHEWTARGNTPNTDQLSETDISSPTFYVPDEVDSNETYEYTLTVSGPHLNAGAGNITVTVRDTDAGVPSLAVTCQIAGVASHASDSGMIISIWERMPDLSLVCEVTDAPEDASYVWSWTASTGMTDLALLSDDDISNPVFDVPDIDGDERHEYIVTATFGCWRDGGIFRGNNSKGTVRHFGHLHRDGLRRPGRSRYARFRFRLPRRRKFVPSVFLVLVSDRSAHGSRYRHTHFRCTGRSGPEDA